MKATWIVAAALAALVATGASAAQTTLALKKVVAARRDDVFLLRIDLNHAWKSGVFTPGSSSSLTVLYETTGDSKTDYTGRITFHDGQLFETITGHGTNFPQVPVSRPTATAARFLHPSDVLFPDPENPGTLGIIVVLKQSGLVDRLPRKGWWQIPHPR